MIIEIRAPIETTLIRTNNHLYTTQNKQKKSLVIDPLVTTEQNTFLNLLHTRDTKKVDFFKKKNSNIQLNGFDSLFEEFFPSSK